MAHFASFRTLLLTGGLFLFPSLAGCASCHANRPDVENDPFHGKGLGGSGVYLFGYDPIEASQLNSKLGSGSSLVAVKLSTGSNGEARLDVLSDCQVAGSYEYRLISMTQQKLVITSEDQLKAELPLSYAKFSGSFKKTSHLEIAWMSPGAYFARPGQVSLGENCVEATHVIESVAVGAFRTLAGATLNAGGTASGPGIPGSPGAEGGTKSSDTLSTSAGSFDTCNYDGKGAPPLDCSSPLKITLRPVKSMVTNTSSCNDASLINTNNLGFMFTGQIFTIEHTQLSLLDGPTADPEFGCKQSLTAGETKAVARIVSFLQANASVKAHVSVWCTPLIPLSPANPHLHEQSIRAQFAAAGLAGRVEFDNCLPLPFSPIGSNGVYVELTSGCKEFTVAPPLKCQKAK